MGQYDPKKPSAFNIVNIIIVLVIGTVLYVGAWYLPHWYPVFQLGGIMRGIGNEGYRQTDDKELMKKLLHEAVRTKLGLTAENFSIERTAYLPEELHTGPDGKPLSDSGRKLLDKRGRSISIHFENTVDAKWPFQEKYTPITFQRTITVDLAIIKW